MIVEVPESMHRLGTRFNLVPWQKRPQCHAPFLHGPISYSVSILLEVKTRSDRNDHKLAYLLFHRQLAIGSSVILKQIGDQM